MTPLQRWAEEKGCCCSHPERYACAEEQERSQLPLDDVMRSFARERIDEVEPCGCYCHNEFFEDEES